MNGEGICLRNASKCEIEKKGCVCPGCRVYINNKYKGDYFCVNGKAEKKQL
ncbi:DUF2769 domain-containing protein [Candidatus Micrarchaeota archaeon]|nr:DUF2769 domain-containing protein [Candidatus Micrarchaeota archaeon]